MIIDKCAFLITHSSYVFLIKFDLKVSDITQKNMSISTKPKISKLSSHLSEIYLAVEQ